MISFPLLLFLASLALCIAFTPNGDEYKRCFDVLGVSPTDSMATIKSRYRQLALLYHPDRLITQVEPAGLRTMQDINEAYECALRSFSTHEANQQFKTGFSNALSEKGERLVEKGWKLWRDIPKTEQDEIIVQLKEYFGSDMVAADIFFLVSQYWTSNDIEALQTFVRIIVFFLKIFSVLCTIGVITVIYFVSKIMLWIFRKGWAILRCVLTFLWGLVPFRKVKSD